LSSEARTLQAKSSFRKHVKRCLSRQRLYRRLVIASLDAGAPRPIPACALCPCFSTTKCGAPMERGAGTSVEVRLAVKRSDCRIAKRSGRQRAHSERRPVADL